MDVTVSYKNEKLFSMKNSEIVVNTIPQAEFIAQYLFNVNKLTYADHTNGELYDEMVSQADSDEEYEEVHYKYYDPDSYDEYFLCVAACMDEIGVNKMALKCRIKSLLLKYRHLTEELDIPIEEFRSVYFDVIEFGYEKVAAKLMRFHLDKVADVASIQKRRSYKNKSLDRWFDSIPLFTNQINEYQEEEGGDVINKKKVEFEPYQGGNGKWGVMNHEGNRVVEPKYDTIVVCDNRSFDVELRGSRGKVDLMGNEYWSIPQVYINKKNIDDNLKEIDTNLKCYLDERILPIYRICSKEYDSHYIRLAAEEALHCTTELGKDGGVDYIRNYRVSHNMLYAAMIFENIGVVEGYDDHHLTSAKMLRDDPFLNVYFSQKDIDIMAEAIEDHRKISEIAPRSFYGKILRDIHSRMGDRFIILRAFYHSKTYNPHFSYNEHVDDTYKHLLSVYGENGNFEFTLYHRDNDLILEDLRAVLRSREDFENSLKSLISRDVFL